MSRDYHTLTKQICYPQFSGVPRDRYDIIDEKIRRWLNEKMLRLGDYQKGWATSGMESNPYEGISDILELNEERGDT